MSRPISWWWSGQFWNRTLSKWCPVQKTKAISMFLQPYHKNTRLSHYFIQDPKAPQTIFFVCWIIHYSDLRKMNYSDLNTRTPKIQIWIIHFPEQFIFYSDLLSIFLRICGYNSGFAIENSQNSVCLDWLSAQPKTATASTMAGAKDELGNVNAVHLEVQNTNWEDWGIACRHWANCVGPWCTSLGLISSMNSFARLQCLRKVLTYHSPQHTATLSNTLQHTATHCNTLQHTAEHCNTLPHCNTLQDICTGYAHNTLQRVRCSVLQCVAVCCTLNP